MQRRLFVINPASGGRDKDDLIEKIKSNFEDAQFFETTGKNDSDRLNEYIYHAKPDLVVISGGDGTINEMSTALIAHDVPMGIIPKGSANGLATELGITMENALQTIKLGHTRNLDVVSINDHLMIHMADIGLNASLIKRYEEEDRRGFLGYAISAIKELPNLEESFEVTISSDDFEITLNTKFVVMANTRMYGTGYEINPNGVLDDQKIEICVLKELSPEFISNKLFNNKPNISEQSIFAIYPVKNAEITTNRAVNWQSDGEYLGTTDHLSIEVLDTQLKTICP
ncbi:MAG: YegS/Rv2252/BmrU family lipid kinase [Marinoscillum sp.]